MGNITNDSFTSNVIRDYGRSSSRRGRKTNSWIKTKPKQSVVAIIFKEERYIYEDRHTSLGLTNEQVFDMYKTMLLARKIDERMWLLNRAGKISFVISCLG